MKALNISNQTRSGNEYQSGFLWQSSRSSAYHLFVWVALGLMLIALLLSALTIVDQRELYDINVWIKPLKFAVSLAIYAATLALLCSMVAFDSQQKSWFKAYCGVIVISILYEIVWVTGAASLGIRSHFNTDTPLMDAAYATAGVAALILTSGAMVFGLLIANNKTLAIAPALKTSIWTSSVAMCVLTVLSAGYLSAQPHHFIGGNLSDAEALPILGWATDGGDLRVAHFFSSHVFHFVPLFTLVAVKLGVTHRGVTQTFLLFYIGFVVYTFIEALLGFPFLGLMGITF